MDGQTDERTGKNVMPPNYRHGVGDEGHRKPLKCNPYNIKLYILTLFQ